MVCMNTSGHETAMTIMSGHLYGMGLARNC
jgi:hypothetical protein